MVAAVGIVAPLNGDREDLDRTVFARMAAE
jgi:hypothetical protein